jgi:hypothetical protein
MEIVFLLFFVGAAATFVMLTLFDLFGNAKRRARYNRLGGARHKLTPQQQETFRTFDDTGTRPQ